MKDLIVMYFSDTESCFPLQQEGPRAVQLTMFVSHTRWPPNEKGLKGQGLKAQAAKVSRSRALAHHIHLVDAGLLDCCARRQAVQQLQHLRCRPPAFQGEGGRGGDGGGEGGRRGGVGGQAPAPVFCRAPEPDAWAKEAMHC